MAKKVVAAGSSKYPWEQAMAYFVDGYENPAVKGERLYPNLVEVADAFSIPYQQVRARSSRFRWPDLRVEAQAKFYADQRRRRIQDLSKKAIGFDDQALNIAETGFKMINMRMAEIAQQVQATAPRRKDALERLSQGHPVAKEEIYSAIYHVELERLASAASRFQEIGRRALGTDVQQVQVDAEVSVSGQISVQKQLNQPDSERLAQIIGIMKRTEFNIEEVLGVVADDVPELESGEEEPPEDVEGEVL